MRISEFATQALLAASAALFSECSAYGTYYQNNAFTPNDNGFEGRNSWYSPYQQYSTPQKKYVPTASHPIFATCTGTAISGSPTTSTVFIAHFPGKAPILKYDFNFSAVDFMDEEMSVRIHEFGVVASEGNV